MCVVSVTMKHVQICVAVSQQPISAWPHVVITGQVTLQSLIPDTHRCVGKHTGLTNHVERFNATLRNRLGRFTRKTLSFSKKKENHEAVLHLFLLKYNQDMKDIAK